MFFDGINDDLGVFDVFLRQNGQHIYQGLTVHIEIAQAGEILLFNFWRIRHFKTRMYCAHYKRIYWKKGEKCIYNNATQYKEFLHISHLFHSIKRQQLRFNSKLKICLLKFSHAFIYRLYRWVNSSHTHAISHHVITRLHVSNCMVLLRLHCSVTK